MILIRSCTQHDVDFVLKAVEELEAQSFNQKEFAALYFQNLTNSNIFYFLAEQNSIPAGFGSLHIQHLLHHEGPVAEIQELVVMPDYRSSGIGKQLLDHITLLAAEKGCCMLELASNRSRMDAHRFYLREGFIDSHHKFTKKL